jgi:hypothetical protein
MVHPLCPTLPQRHWAYALSGGGVPAILEESAFLKLCFLSIDEKGWTSLSENIETIHGSSWLLKRFRTMLNTKNMSRN